MATKKGQLRITSRRAYSGLRKRRSSTASPAYKKLESRKMALESRYRKLREKTKDKAGPVGAALCVSSGGAIAGAVSTTQFSSVMGIPTPLLLGVAGTTYGIYSNAKLASQVACLSSGMLAKWAGDYAESIMLGGSINPLATIGEEEAK